MVFWICERDSNSSLFIFSIISQYIEIQLKSYFSVFVKSLIVLDAKKILGDQNNLGILKQLSKLDVFIDITTN